eukprot:TRINITY_DN696_c0_g2_i1.p2 TRINITY_DN696_c0_g2~~TRINITY_DN696_c0_g2_i1.p2  ORF type:complete len:170 (-),score=40.36 TRINITY_DN696_c0_g2_i1:242-751(-)
MGFGGMPGVSGRSNGGREGGGRRSGGRMSDFFDDPFFNDGFSGGFTSVSSSFGGGMGGGVSKSVSQSTVVKNGQTVQVTKTTIRGADGSVKTEVSEKIIDQGGRVSEKKYVQDGARSNGVQHLEDKKSFAKKNTAPDWDEEEEERYSKPTRSTRPSGGQGSGIRKTTKY